MIFQLIQDLRPLMLAGTVLFAVIYVLLRGPIPQPPGYHNFVDKWPFLGVRNFSNTVSNLPFLLVGIAGLIALRSHAPEGALPALRWAYFAFFLGSVLLSLGSAYYHLTPTNRTLAWDRLPMTIVFMAFFTIIIGEHISPTWGFRLLVPLILLGVSSVFFWRLTDSGTGGDLRLYGLVQYLSLTLSLFIVILYPAALIPTFYVWAALISYAVSKALEHFDRNVLQLTGFVSGHTLKHLFAALGIFFFLVGLLLRRPA